MVLCVYVSNLSSKNHIRILFPFPPVPLSVKYCLLIILLLSIFLCDAPKIQNHLHIAFQIKRVEKKNMLINMWYQTFHKRLKFWTRMTELARRMCCILL